VAVPPADLGSQILYRLDRIAAALEDLVEESHRIADHIAPAPGDIVGTPFLAQQLGCSVVWAAEMARNGQIPRNCIVPGTGNGRPWKFRRRQIESRPVPGVITRIWALSDKKNLEMCHVI
jgi:hypothetical protein